ncbi:oligosaccharide flippase family protein [Halalkalicoccus salilacus]|uniref:oligosaccharide flippase family protein n=1 Tax=Halalkalicoccus salilacus TaxID=3117459 RepID=UPI00300F4280
MGRDIIRGFLSILGGRVGRMVLSILVTPVLVRVLGSRGYGDYALVMSAMTLLMIVVNAGIFDGVRKYIAEARAFPDWENHIFGFYTRLAGLFVSLVVLLIIALTSTGVISWVFGHRFSTYFYVVAVLLIGNQFYELVRGALMGFGQEHYSEPLVVLNKFLFSVVGVGLAYLGYGVTGALFGHLVATLVVTVVGGYFLKRHLSLSFVARPVPSEFPRRELFSFNAFSVVLIFLTMSLYHIDILLLQPLSGSEQTGQYKAALVIAEFLWFVPMAVQLVLLQATSELWANEDVDQITTIAARVTRYTLLLTLLMALGLAALADPFVPLYFGPDFAAAIDPLLLLLPGVLGFAIARPIYAIGQGKGDLRILILATGIAALLNVVLNLLLIPRFGMYGAAIATSIGYGSMAGLHVWSARRIGFDPLADLRFGRIAVTAIGSAPVILGAAYVIPWPLLALIVVPLLGFTVYVSLAVWTGALGTLETRRLLRRLPAPLNRLQRLL